MKSQSSTKLPITELKIRLTNLQMFSVLSVGGYLGLLLRSPSLQEPFNSLHVNQEIEHTLNKWILASTTKDMLQKETASPDKMLESMMLYKFAKICRENTNHLFMYSIPPVSFSTVQLTKVS